MSEDTLKEILGELRKQSEQQGRYDKPLTRDEAAEYLQVHPDTLYRWARDGEISYSRLGDGKTAPMRFWKKDLDAFLSKKRIPGVEECRGV